MEEVQTTSNENETPTLRSEPASATAVSAGTVHLLRFFSKYADKTRSPHQRCLENY